MYIFEIYSQGSDIFKKTFQDDTDIDKLTDEITKIFTTDKVASIQIDNSSIILRPSKINIITITKIDDNTPDQSIPTQTENDIEQNNKDNEIIDVIKDVSS